jgi:hypothetical protein
MPNEKLHAPACAYVQALMQREIDRFDEAYPLRCIECGGSGQFFDAPSGHVRQCDTCVRCGRCPLCLEFLRRIPTGLGQISAWDFGNRPCGHSGAVRVPIKIDVCLCKLDAKQSSNVTDDDINHALDMMNDEQTTERGYRT